MRVITGKYKGRHFDIPHTFKARPTTDFAKENLFNVLNGYIDFEDCIQALDLFAGTGSITIELLSRGCDNVVSIERDPLHFSFIIKILKELKAENTMPIRTDVFRFIKKCKPGTFDFIFADPPYAIKELDTIPDLIMDHQLLKPEGLFVLEHGKDKDFTSHPCFIEHRAYGSVNFSFFKPQDTTVKATDSIPE